MTELRFKAAWVTSLLLAIAAAGLWIRSDRHSSRFAFSTAHARYTFWSEEGKLRLMGPARPGPPDQQKKGWDLLRRLKNEDISWELARHQAATNREFRGI